MENKEPGLIPIELMDCDYRITNHKFYKLIAAFEDGTENLRVFGIQERVVYPLSWHEYGFSPSKFSAEGDSRFVVS